MSSTMSSTTQSSPQGEQCPCTKKYKEAKLVSIEGESWFECDFQGCQMRVSGARHFWRPGEGKALGDTSKNAPEEAEDEEEEDTDTE